MSALDAKMLTEHYTPSPLLFQSQPLWLSRGPMGYVPEPTEIWTAQAAWLGVSAAGNQFALVSPRRVEVDGCHHYLSNLYKLLTPKTEQMRLF